MYGRSPLTGSTTGPCPEGGLNTNDDGINQVSQAQNHLWGAVNTAINQTFRKTTEQHAGVAYWVVGTRSFDKFGFFTLTSQGYVSAKHEDLEFPALAAEGFPWQDGGNGGAIMVVHAVRRRRNLPGPTTAASSPVAPSGG